MGQALVILPERRQPVQTDTRFLVPLTMARTVWMFGLQRRFVRTWEWLTLLPNDGFFPQVSHTEAMMVLQKLLRAARGRAKPVNDSIDGLCPFPPG
jgi:hypothetical protein